MIPPGSLHRAEGLKKGAANGAGGDGSQGTGGPKQPLVGTFKVYVKATVQLEDVKKEEAEDFGTTLVACSSAAINIPGEDSYRWAPTMDNVCALKLPQDHTETKVGIELKHGNGAQVLAGEGTLLGKLELDWKQNSEWGKSKWHTLDTGGRVELTFHSPLPGF